MLSRLVVSEGGAIGRGNEAEDMAGDMAGEEGKMKLFIDGWRV